MDFNPEILLSSAYLPNIHYFSKLLSGKKVAIEVHDNYQKQSFRNRTVILSANGPLNLVIPVIKPNGNNTKTRDILIDYEPPWQQVHWKAIVSAYKHSSFFEIFEEELKPAFHRREKYLLDWNFLILDQIYTISGIARSYVETDNYINANLKEVDDYRDSIHPKARMQKEDVHFEQQSYFQVFSNKFGFVPNLSFIDLLFNEGSEAEYICKKCIKKGQRNMPL
jgi:WbqC-like protein family